VNSNNEEKEPESPDGTEQPASSLSRKYGSRLEIFDELMPFRVYNILIVSSLYDSYILEEDGRLRDLLAKEYQSLNLTSAPNVKRVTTGELAFRQLEKRDFDLVITMMRLGDMDAFDFGRQVKERFDNLPVILLAYNTRELEQVLERHTGKEIDRVFVWHGDGRILLAIVKYLEDMKNSEHDITIGGVPAIILIEDSVNFYSSYLPIIYAELVRQTQHVLRSETTLTRKYIRTRARPKVLLATSYEEGWALFEKYRDNLMGVISDCRFPRHSVISDTAGIDFARQVRMRLPDMPILLQSRNEEYASLAKEIQVAFLQKNSRSLLRDLSLFINRNFGFGDFVFYTPDGKEADRATDLHQMEKILQRIAPESLKWHAERHHFSRWLMARTEFEVARKLKGYDVSNFESIEKVRAFLLESLANLCRQAHAGTVTVYSQSQCREHSCFVRIGSGSLGGKGRGLAFMHGLLDHFSLSQQFEDVLIRVPRTAVIASDVFDQFMDDNNLRQLALSDAEDQEIVNSFVRNKLKFKFSPDLESFIEGPIAVRSSSLLEDAFYQPFAGTYHTIMLPNTDPDPAVRREHLSRAIRYVYASTYFRSAKAYIDVTPNRVEEEKMAVVVQETIGRYHGKYFYPDIAGICRSYNYYSVGPQEPDHGVAHVVLGLGNKVVEGGLSLRFSPLHPHVLPQFSNIEATLANSQKDFSALDMTRAFFPTESDPAPNLVDLGLDVAEAHGTLWPVGSTYSAVNDRIYDGISHPGVRLVSFAHILKSGLFPLAPILEKVLSLGLQIRPMVIGQEREDLGFDDLLPERVMCYCAQALGNGSNSEPGDIIYIKPKLFDAAQTRKIATQVSHFNEMMKIESRSYILIGPGRWGSSDAWLGIPVTWNQVSQARAIVEVSFKDFTVEPSQGSHFFQNLTAFEVGYFSLNPASQEDRVDWDWLEAQEVVKETDFIRHIRTCGKIEIRIDGQTGRGAILKPESDSKSSE